MALFQEDEKPSRRVPLLNPRFREDKVSGRTTVLDEVGARIWEMLSETPVTPEQICDRLETEYDVDRATLESDVLDLLEDLHAEGIVHTSVAVE